MAKALPLTLADARAIWLRAQRLDSRTPFGEGPTAVPAAIGHLGYVQIDTINVIERCHHHILFSRIPAYRRADLHRAQSRDKTVFEYWTHALAYLPVGEMRFFLPQMRAHRRSPRLWGQTVDPKDYRRVIRMIRDGGPITIRDIEDDTLVEKEHLWASRKPSKGALQLAFWNGILAICSRSGMLKTYELMDRHFGWNAPPRPATERQVLDYQIDRAVRAQGLVSLESIAHGRPGIRKELQQRIDSRVRRGLLLPVDLPGAGRSVHWAPPEILDALPPAPDGGLVHILSPFDPLIIQRKRTKLFFDYDHVFEAYVPREKRRFGYFALPVLVGDKIVALLDLKTDRAAGRLLIQAWHWVGDGGQRHMAAIEGELARFEAFQLGD